MRGGRVFLLSLALFGHLAVAQYGDDEGDAGYGGGGGGGYGEGDDGPPPPPPPGDVQELLSLEEMDAFIDNADASVIGAFTAKEMEDPAAVKPEGWDDDEDGEWAAPVIENPTLTDFKSISGAVYGYRYAYTVEPALLEKLKAKKGGLFVFKSPKFLSKEHGDRPRERYPSTKLSESAVSNWLAAKSQPLVGQYSFSTKDRYKGATLIIFMNLDFEKNAKSIAYVLKRARKAAVGLKGKLAVAVASLSEMNYDLGDYGLESTNNNVDIRMGIKKGSDHFGSDATAFSGPALTAFADKYLAGELTAFVKPDPPPTPEGDDDSPPPDEGAYDDAGEEEEEPKEEM